MAEKRDITIKKRRQFQYTKPPKPDRNQDSESNKASEASDESVKRKLRKRRNGRSAVRVVLFRLLAFGMLLAIGITIWVNWDSLAPSGFSDWLDETFYGGVKGNGFPVPISGSKVVKMAPVSSCLAVLTDTTFMMYNNTGGEVVRLGHTYEKPILKAAGDFALLAEQGGTRLQLITKKKTVFSIHTEVEIVAASVSDKGYVGLITQSNRGYVSEIAVYNPEGKLIFRRSSDVVLVDVAIRSDGQQVAVASVTAEAGAMKSSLQVFSTREKQDKPVASHSGTEIMLVAVRYLPNNLVAAVGDTEGWLLDPENNSCQTRSYDGKQLLGFAVSDKEALMAVHQQGTAGGGDLLILDSSKVKKTDVPFSGTYRDVNADGHDFMLLTDDGLQTLNDTGLQKNAAWAAGGLMVSSLKEKPVVLQLSEIKMES